MTIDQLWNFMLKVVNVPQASNVGSLEIVEMYNKHSDRKFLGGEVKNQSCTSVDAFAGNSSIICVTRTSYMNCNQI